MGYGIFHEKLGIFEDLEGNRVSFRGSSNETWSGWHSTGNHEAFEVFRSWVDDGEASRVARHAAYFDDLWLGHVKDVDCMPLPRLARQYLQALARPSLDALMSESKTSIAPPRRPLKHQSDAIADWNAKGRRGILKHATGSGKTFTALCALQDHLDGSRCALILVPSQLLAAQWITEIRREIDNVTILAAGAGNTGWRAKGRVESFSTAAHEIGKRVIVATLQTACKEEFLRRLQGGPHLMVVCDEVHRAGSRIFSDVFSIHAGPRLGLSATPERFGDPEGTARLFNYFGAILEPIFTLRDAISAKRLVPYEYYPHTVQLTANEEEEWQQLSERIGREIASSGCAMNSNTSNTPLPDSIKLLLIKRARISKKARNKVPLACDILRLNYRPGERWLVYCEDTDQLYAVSQALRAISIDTMEYHSSMGGEPSDTLSWFKQFGGVLVSIRCLDEGVDIPEISHALILASSKNPREFIQRRGRVLRTAPQKHLAVVHDAIVVPGSRQPEPDSLSLVKSELARAVEFSRSSLNTSAHTELLALAVGLGIDPTAFANVGLEDDDNE
jgi:superfamily II DNA or RNA helicase